MDKYAFYLPTRKGSERVKNKNTKPFAGIEGGLVRLRIEELLKVKEVGKIVVSTNDSETIKIAKSFNNDRIVIDERPEYLCVSSTVIEDLIAYVPSVVDAEHIIWVHATTPFANHDVISKAILAYERNVINGDFDSLMSVSKFQEFLWSPKLNNYINHDRNVVKWPRTQDLEPLYVINHAIYINHRNTQLIERDRIGKKPYLFELDRIESFDIDWEDDYKLAEIIYRYYLNQK